MLLLPVLFFNLIFQIGDIIGYVEPRYDFLCFAFTFCYLTSFVMSLIYSKDEGIAMISDD